MLVCICFFFFQAEDGIRDLTVTGVQTCALPICRILDLYERRWNGGPLRASEFVLCADEKTSIQARCRKHSSLAPSPARPMRVEHEYHRAGAWTYLAAWDVKIGRAHV